MVFCCASTHPTVLCMLLDMESAARCMQSKQEWHHAATLQAGWCHPGLEGPVPQSLVRNDHLLQRQQGRPCPALQRVLSLPVSAPGVDATAAVALLRQRPHSLTHPPCPPSHSPSLPRQSLTLPALPVAWELWVAELSRHPRQPAGEGLQQRRTARPVQPHPQVVPACA